MLRSSRLVNLVCLSLVCASVWACGGTRGTEDGASDGDERSDGVGEGDSDAIPDGDSPDGDDEGDTSSTAGDSGSGGATSGASSDDDATTDTDTTGAGATNTGSGGSGSSAAGGTGGSGATTGAAGAGGEAGASHHYDCGAFSEDAGWTVLDGFRAVVVAGQSDGLKQPVAATFAEAAFGGLLYVVNQGDNSLLSVDIATGRVEVVVAPSDWDQPPVRLTTIVWDEHGVFDGNLYVGDQGSNHDNNSRVYRVTPTGEATTFVEGGYGLDDVYGLAFPPPESDYAPGLYVTGDTDSGARPDWGRIDEDGNIVEFSEVAGAEGIVFDTTGTFDNALWASRPNGGGYSGDDTISSVDESGAPGRAIVSGIAGLHAVTISGGGDLGVAMYAASWSTGQLFQISPAGDVTNLASGLRLTNYDGNILAPSSDGNVLFVADRLLHQVVCIEAL